MRNIFTKEKLKDKSPRGQVYVEAHHEEVQGRELRGQGHLGVDHRSHRDEEARETTPARLHSTKERHNTNLEEHNTADLHTKMLGEIENAVARKET